MADVNYPLRQPRCEITYNGKAITADLQPFLLSVSYTDHLEGESDEIELQLMDSLARWRTVWYPGLGDSLTLALGYAGEALLTCGTFELDQVEFTAPPDVVTLRALSAGVTKATRTRRSAGYEQTTLRAIAEEVARRHGLRLVGEPPAVSLDRATQLKETDLAFLNRLAAEFGASFKMNGEQLVFTALAERRASMPVLTLVPEQVTSWRFTDKIRDVYQTAKVRYHDPKTRRLVTAETTAIGPTTAGRRTSEDTLEVTARAPDQRTAQAQADAAIAKKNLDKLTGNITLPGEVNLVGGLTLTLADWGKLSGQWLIQSARHTLDRSSGLVTELELRRL